MVSHVANSTICQMVTDELQSPINLDANLEAPASIEWIEMVLHPHIFVGY